MESGGAEIGGVADSFTFVSRKVTGDFELLSRIQSLQMASPDSTAGLMVRANDTEPGAANCLRGRAGRPDEGGLPQRSHRQRGGASTAVMDVGIRDGQWLRLTRTGRTITAYRSTQLRVNWTRIGSVDVDFPAEVVAGLAVASRNPTRPTVTELTTLRMHNLGSQATTRTGPWTRWARGGRCRHPRRRWV